MIIFPRGGPTIRNIVTARMSRMVNFSEPGRVPSTLFEGLGQGGHVCVPERVAERILKVPHLSCVRSTSREKRVSRG